MTGAEDGAAGEVVEAKKIEKQPHANGVAGGRG